MLTLFKSTVVVFATFLASSVLIIELFFTKSAHCLYSCRYIIAKQTSPPLKLIRFLTEVTHLRFDSGDFPRPYVREDLSKWEMELLNT